MTLGGFLRPADAFRLPEPLSTRLAANAHEVILEDYQRPFKLAQQLFGCRAILPGSSASLNESALPGNDLSTARDVPRG
jgi:hypothetical protein